MTPMPAGIPPCPSGTGQRAPLSCVPIIPHAGNIPRALQRDPAAVKRNGTRLAGKRDPALARDTFYEIRHNNAYHVISENYSYKTESYYSILRHELEGEPVCPSTRAVLDAYVVPLCLERARLTGIPVCDWGISQGYVPLPSVLYGLNYFASTAEFCVVSNDDQAKEATRHITNKGKYPLCYQKLSLGSEVSTCTAVFGKTAGACSSMEHLARRVYDLFAIPLVTMVVVTDGTMQWLSSLCPTRYSQLSDGERALVLAYLNRQEFL